MCIRDRGDGTIDICQNYPSIYTCSIHSESNFPFEKKKGWMDVAIPAGSGDDFYLSQLQKTLENIKDRISPDIVLYDAGVDVFSGDGLGNLEVTREGIIKRDEIVLEHFQSRNIPVATVIGGGYSSDTDELASRHAIIFNVAARIYKIL